MHDHTAVCHGIAAEAHRENACAPEPLHARCLFSTPRSSLGGGRVTKHLQPGSSAAILHKSIALIALVVLFAVPLFAKQKDDVVIMKNGDRFTGESKALQYGELIVKADYMKD